MRLGCGDQNKYTYRLQFLEKRNNHLATFRLLYASRLDLSHAAFYADCLRENGLCYEPWEVAWHDYLHQGAYVTALVISYCRPFTESRGRLRFPKKILRVLNDEQKAMHHKLLDLRNNVYAHTDLALRNIRPISFEGKKHVSQIIPPMLFDVDELITIRVLIRVISLEINDRIDDLYKILGD